MRLSGRFAILYTVMCFAVILTRRRVGSGTWRWGLPILLLFLLEVLKTTRFTAIP